MKQRLNAVNLKIILIILFVLLLGAVGAGTWWLKGVLHEFVLAKDHAQIDSELSALELEKLRFLQNELAEKSEIVDRANQIAASADNYRYQDQVINDVEVYAKRNGIVISGFTFGGESSQNQNQKAPAGTRLTPFSLTLSGPIEFTKFMQFLRDIENNLTKIQVTSLTLAPDPENLQMVTNPSLGLVVYLRN